MLKTEALTPLFHFRKELYDNLGLRQDSLFEPLSYESGCERWRQKV